MLIIDRFLYQLFMYFVARHWHPHAFCEIISSPPLRLLTLYTPPSVCPSVCPVPVPFTDRADTALCRCAV